MARRIYEMSAKKKALLLGIPFGTIGCLITLYILLSVEVGAITITGHSGNMTCWGMDMNGDGELFDKNSSGWFPQFYGNYSEPCFYKVNFTVHNDTFWYATGYDPWGRNESFGFDPAVESWELYRSWGKGYRRIPMDTGCTGSWCGCSWCRKNLTSTFAVAWREPNNYTIMVVATKKESNDTIKWRFGDVDPYWLGTEKKKNPIILNDEVPTIRKWKLVPKISKHHDEAFNKTIIGSFEGNTEQDVSDYIETDWKRIDNLTWDMVLIPNKTFVSDALKSANREKAQREVALKYFGNESKWKEVRDFDRVPIRILGDEQNFSMRKNQTFRVELPYWKDGWEVGIGFGTLYWDTTTECVINTSRSYSDETIYQACDVTINNSATLTLRNVTYWINQTSGDQYDFTIKSDGTFNMTGGWYRTVVAGQSQRTYCYGTEYWEDTRFATDQEIDYVWDDYCNATLTNITMADAGNDFHFMGYCNVTGWNCSFDTGYKILFREHAQTFWHDTDIVSSYGTYLVWYYDCADCNTTFYGCCLSDGVYESLWLQGSDYGTCKGFVDLSAWFAWKFVYSDAFIWRFFPVFIYSDNAETVPYSGVTVTLTREGAVQDTRVTDANGRVDLEMFVNNTYDLMAHEIHANGVWVGNITSRTDTSCTGLRYNITAPSPPTANDTCNCTSIQNGTTINCSESCNISAACDAMGTRINIVGAGHIKVLADVTNWTAVHMEGLGATDPNRCVVTCSSGCFRR